MALSKLLSRVRPLAFTRRTLLELVRPLPLVFSS
ncbi:hypothetical protein L917_00977 [Phytophthora nicotianae]|uniref:Uncharacterized protein n=1 Tax=Phytophthora nicotianae TaxID=4792 RepID=W2P6H4_PHYNI|nr:hypothetical protein L917_00977 [Phytophthora nicotianae]ETM55823.1 hypothetical protein L914_01015 [Phytophthora nicotianae]